MFDRYILYCQQVMAWSMGLFSYFGVSGKVDGIFA